MEKRSKGTSLDYLAYYYDKITPAEKSRFRRRQMRLVNNNVGDTILEVGCGTGALSILAKLAAGESGVVEGIDIAPRMVARAFNKARASDLEIGFRYASIDALPFHV